MTLFTTGLILGLIIGVKNCSFINNKLDEILTLFKIRSSYLNREVLIENGWEELPKKYHIFNNPTFRKDHDKIISLYSDRKKGSISTLASGYNTHFSYVEGETQIISRLSSLNKLEEYGKLGGWENKIKEIDNERL